MQQAERICEAERNLKGPCARYRAAQQAVEVARAFIAAMEAMRSIDENTRREHEVRNFEEERQRRQQRAARFGTGGG